MPDTEKYEDILDLPHHVSPTRRRMTMAERAAQFSPFAALVGYEGAVRETGRVTEQEAELSEDEKAVLDHKQWLILAALAHGERPLVTVIYFQPDGKKAGGKYVTIQKVVKKIDSVEQTLTMLDGSTVRINQITGIELPWEIDILM